MILNFIGPWLRGGRESHGVVIDGGGLDVAVAPRSGFFVIPIGPPGIMFVKPGTTDKNPVTVSASDKGSLNFSRVLALPGTTGNDLIVCAGRRGGLGFTEFCPGVGRHTLTTVKFDDLDLVDVCSMGGLSVTAAAKDGSLVLFRDILTDRKPLTVKFRSVTGPVYRVLCAQGDIYLLTSKGLFGLFGLAERFLKGTTRHQFTTEILRIPIEAADANLVQQKWLLAVGVENVFRFDLDQMPKSPHQANKDGQWEEPEEFGAQPLWEESSFEQRAGNMATV